MVLIGLAVIVVVIVVLLIVLAVRPPDTRNPAPLTGRTGPARRRARSAPPRGLWPKRTLTSWEHADDWPFRQGVPAHWLRWPALLRLPHVFGDASQPGDR
jgi:hypothetical protein